MISPRSNTSGSVAAQKQSGWVKTHNVTQVGSKADPNPNPENQHLAILV